MRIFLPLIFIIVSCSSTFEKKRDPAANEHYRLELTLADTTLFSNGVDTTFLKVIVYDQNGYVRLDLPAFDFKLLSSEDIEAKPFIKKKDHYSTQIRPKAKSRPFNLQVSFQDKSFSDVIRLQTTISPLKDHLKPILNNESEQLHVGSNILYQRGDQFLDRKFESFELTNHGGNKIIPGEKYSKQKRSFVFEYPEQARQNINLRVMDQISEHESQHRYSNFLFFPRNFLPLVEEEDDRLIVLLPTGEEVIFDKESKMIMGGVLAENALNLNQLEFPPISYKGQGVVLRANALGSEPELNNEDKNVIDFQNGFNGSQDVLIISGQYGKRCRRPKKDFWDDLDSNFIQFKYPTDREFNIYLKKHCGFEIPKL